MKTTKTTRKTKRGMIKQLLNRTKAYRISDYVRKISKALCRSYSVREITDSLLSMEREGQLIFTIDGNTISGLLVK